MLAMAPCEFSWLLDPTLHPLSRPLTACPLFVQAGRAKVLDMLTLDEAREATDSLLRDQMALLQPLKHDASAIDVLAAALCLEYVASFHFNTCHVTGVEHTWPGADVFCVMLQ